MVKERKRRFHDTEEIFPVIKDRLQRGFAPGVFAGVHTFTASGDIPDDFGLRLLFLAADYDSVSRLKEQVRSLLAWQS